MYQSGESGLAGVLETNSFSSSVNESWTTSLIYVSKHSNAGLLIIIDQQFLLFMNRFRENI